MTQCLRLRNNGKQCQRPASKKRGHSSQFCWQHQKFHNLVLQFQPTTKPDLISEQQPTTKSEMIFEQQPTTKTEMIFEQQPTTKPQITPEQQPTFEQAVCQPFIEPIYDRISKAQNSLEKSLSRKGARHPSRNLTQLYGPESFIFFPNIKGKRILLMGKPRYSQDSECNSEIYEVHQWLGDLSKNSSESVDLFVATSNQLPSNLIDSNGELQFHSIDVRRYLSGNTYLLDPFQMMIIKLMVIRPDLSWNQAEKLIRRAFSNLTNQYKKDKKVIFSYLFGINRSQIYQALIVGFFNDLAKQIQVPIDSQDFNKYLAIYFKNIDKELSKMHHSIDKKKFLTTLMKSHLEGPFDLLMDVPINIYFLSKFLTIFDENKISSLQKNQRKQQRPPSEIKNAIVYSDSNYAGLYAKFLVNYYGVRPKINQKMMKDGECLKFDQPFDFFET